MSRAPLAQLYDDNDEAWDVDTDAPSVLYFGNALQVWSGLQGRDVTVAEAALTFNATPEVIRQAVEAHPWLLLRRTGDAELIEHEGE